MGQTDEQTKSKTRN